MAKKIACPFFSRRVSSYRFYGLKCTARFEHGETVGQLEQWGKEQREKKVTEHCNGCYQECHIYKNNQLNGGRF